MMRRRLVSVAVALVAALALSSCTDPSPERPEPTETEETTAAEEEAPEDEPEAEPQFSDDDVTHAQELITLHLTSLELHQVIRSKADVVEEVDTLSLSLYTSHYDEVQALEGMLTDWGAEVPQEQDTEVVTDAEIRELGPASGDAANALYLEQMIALHQARSSICEDVILDGENPELVDLAQSMLNSQQHEVTHMREILAGLDVEDEPDDGGGDGDTAGDDAPEDD